MGPPARTDCRTNLRRDPKCAARSAGPRAASGAWRRFARCARCSSLKAMTPSLRGGIVFDSPARDRRSRITAKSILSGVFMGSCTAAHARVVHPAWCGGDPCFSRYLLLFLFYGEFSWGVALLRTHAWYTQRG